MRSIMYVIVHIWIFGNDYDCAYGPNAHIIMHMMVHIMVIGIVRKIQVMH